MSRIENVTPRAFEPKAVQDWKEYDLKRFNIKVVEKDFQGFFGQPPPKVEGFEAAALNDWYLDQDNWKKYRPETLQFLTYAQDINLGRAKALDFAEALLSFTGYLVRPRHIGRGRICQWRCCNAFVDVD